MSKHSVTFRGLRVVTTCWSWAWSDRTSPSKWVGLGSPLAASSMYGDLTCSVHTVNNLCMFNRQCHFYLCNRGPYVRLAFVPNMLSSWNKDIIIIILLLCPCVRKSRCIFSANRWSSQWNCISTQNFKYFWRVYYFMNVLLSNEKQWPIKFASLLRRTPRIAT